MRELVEAVQPRRIIILILLMMTLRQNTDSNCLLCSINYSMHNECYISIRYVREQEYSVKNNIQYTSRWPTLLSITPNQNI